jgi:hypothetical protein
MKKFLLIAILGILALNVSAQTTFKNSGVTEGIVRSKTTTNATATTVDSVIIAPGEVGFITIKAVGVTTDTASGVTGIRTYRFKKTLAGALTLGTAVETQAIVADSEIPGGTFAASASSPAGNILIKVTGYTNKTVYWKVQTKVISQKPS